MPAKLEGRNNSVKRTIFKIEGTLKVRVHVERSIRRVKVFRIVRGSTPIRYGHLLSKRWKVSCWLTAVLPPLINDKGDLSNYLLHGHEE